MDFKYPHSLPNYQPPHPYHYNPAAAGAVTAGNISGKLMSGFNLLLDS